MDGQKAEGEEAPRYEAPFAGRSAQGLDPLLIGAVSVIVAFLSVLIFFILKLKRDEDTAQRRRAVFMEGAGGPEDRREANVAGGRRRNVRNRRVNYDGDEDGFANAMAAAEDGNMDEDEEGPSYLEGHEGEKLGKKKLAKLEAKAAKKYQREQELIEREERKKREDEKEEQRAKEREAERLAEEEEKERLQKEKEEREARELEEYLALKESFAIQEEGFDQIEGEEEENLMKNFVDYIKETKVVNIDELAARFSLKSEDAVSRLQHFLDNGELTGVMDDRGKFIYITQEELNAVSKFINQRGRVTISELADYSNRLIKLES